MMFFFHRHRKNSRIDKMIKAGLVAISIALSLLGSTPALALPADAQPADPVAADHDPDTAPLYQGEGQAQPAEPVAGVISTPVECLSTVEGRSPNCAPFGVMQLQWQGEVESARLVMRLVEGSEPRTVTVNGSTTMTVPALVPQAWGEIEGEFIYLSIPPKVLLQGENRIELSGRFDPSDSTSASGVEAWTAMDVRIQVFGSAAGPGLIPIGSPETGTGVGLASGITTVVQGTINFTNPYDDTRQQAAIQIPDSYNSGTPTPLVVFAHPRGAVMSYGLDVFGTATNARGWLLASPEMHGSFRPPRRCYDDPSSCEYFEQLLVDRPGAFAYASLESQYDLIGTVQYMVEHYNVKLSQIYLVGYSMGGQIVAVTGAKFPHVFAAVFDTKGPTDAARWYYEQVAYYPQGEDAYQVEAMRKECHVNNRAKTPAENPFCYEQRSGLRFAGNYIHVPISMTHSASDLLVPVRHSQDLQTAINGYNPDRRASIYYAPAPCGSPYHCFEPDPLAVLNWLRPFVLNQTPDHIHITSDESKPYYWLNLVQTGSEHWTQVEVKRRAENATIEVSAKDNSALTIGRQPGLDANDDRGGRTAGAGTASDDLPDPGRGA